MAEPLEPSFSLAIPTDEDRERRVCDHCGFVDYVNPKVVVGAVAVWSEAGPAFGPDAVPLDQVKVLLCRRAIQPRKGWWTLPAGYMELGETVAQAVKREAREEALAELELDVVLGLYDMVRAGQVQIFHRARLLTPDVGAGPESFEAVLFPWAEIPWKHLAFHSVSWSLVNFEATRLLEAFAPFGTPKEIGWVGPAAAS